MPSTDLPQEHGAVVCEPPFLSWTTLACDNAVLLDQADVRMSTLSLRELRRTAREEVLDAAASFTAQLSGKDPDSLRGAVQAQGPLILTGHQPVLFHPGIWAKYLMLQAAAEMGATCLNLIVDTDEVGRLEVPVPRRTDRLLVTRRLLISCPPGVPFECASVPKEARWDAFVARLQTDLETLDQPELTNRLALMATAGYEARNNAANIGEFLAAVRRGIEESESLRPSYLELPVSQLGETASFLHFLTWIVLDFEHFWTQHNDALNQYRKTARLRSPAQPLPNLREQGLKLELPMWIVHHGRRDAAFAMRENDRVIISTAREEVCRLPASDPEAAVEILSTLCVRPRALSLTMFARLCLGDLFIHGVGGRRYAAGTDCAIKQLLNLPPPPFAVVSATFHLLASADDPNREERRTLHRRLRQLQSHPERYLDRNDPRVRDTMAEKERLLRSLSEGQSTRRERKHAYERIRLITGALAELHSIETGSIEQRLEQLTGMEGEQQAATFREYPFFLFDLQAIRAAVIEQCTE
jgi:hypothetical protein